MTEVSQEATPSTAPAEGAAELATLRQEKEAAVRDAAELKDRLLRQAAELENYRRRVRKEMEEAEARGREKLLGDLLEVVDNLQRALAVAPADNPLTEGVRLVEKQFLATLARYEVTPFESAGQPFDPNLHEAIQMVPSPNVEPNTVLHQASVGYKQGARLLRPARVIVAQAAAGPT